MKKETDDRAHSEFSMSGFSRTVACPASIPLSKLAPPLPDHPSGIEGTEAHKCVEAFLKNPKKPYIIKNFLLKTYPDTMVQHGFETFNKIMAIVAGYPGATFEAETRIDTSHITEKGNFGTTDCVIIAGKTLIIIDYKYGVMPVDPAENWQLIGYALGTAKKHNYKFTYVELVIIQPRRRDNAPKVSVWKTTMKHLRTWEPRFLKAVARTKVKNPVVQIGSHCFFCPARVFNCPAYREKEFENAKELFQDVEADDWLEAFLKPRPKRGEKTNGRKR